MKLNPATFAWTCSIEFGWPPSHCRPYAKGLNKSAADSHDLVLVDYRLGGHSGLDFLQELRAQGNRAPIILLTGLEDEEVDLAAMESGASDYLVKQQLTAPLLERAIRYALKNAAMTAELEELATRDGLTGLYNRREMDRFLREEIHRSKRHGRALAFLMADIDCFKAVNDTCGHQAGDDVLRHVARLFDDSVRPTDRAARYGGEELAVIAPESDREHAVEMAGRLRALIEANPCTAPGERGNDIPISIAISIGVATLPADADSQEGLIAAADQALYAAKEGGRNCVVSYADLKSSPNG